MATFNLTKTDATIERMLDTFPKITADQFEAFIERQRGKLTGYESACVRAMYRARNVQSADEAWALFDSWENLLSPMDTKSERELAFWGWADACIETSLRGAE